MTRVEPVMQHLRKRLKALEKSQALKRGPELLVVERDAVQSVVVQ
jgi:hypothetical protein